MEYWVEKTDKYITIWKQGGTCNDIICYNEYTDYEEEFEIMAKALNESIKPKKDI